MTSCSLTGTVIGSDHTKFLQEDDSLCLPRGLHVSYFAYACKTEGKNDISRLISATA